jgi:hypothetical protein
MMMAKRLLLTIAVFLILSMFAVGSVFAGSVTVNGTIDGTSPTMPNVGIISTPNCTGAYTAFAVHYASFPLTVDAAGVYTITETGTTSALYVLQGSFDPNAVASTCIAASNTNPISLAVSLNPGTTYYVVIIDDTFAQSGLTYQLTVSGPGNPNLGLLTSSDICSLPIPAGSVVGEAPLGAQVYWAPGQESPGLVLNPGTYHVIGQDATETYYKLFFNCQYIWVRKDTMQPSWLPPQNGAPLPQGIVS